MDNTDKEQYLGEILRRIRSGEERTYSIDAVSIMLGLEESGITDAAIEQDN